MDITFKAIGSIHSSHKDIKGMPIQPGAALGGKGYIDVLPEYSEGLKDLDGFSHIILIYYLHKTGAPALIATPFLDQRPRGVFATRAPSRPNPVGLSVVRLLGIKGNRLEIENVDVLDGTPLLDIKPYVPEFDQVEGARVGWLEEYKGEMSSKKADDRFRG